MPGVDHCPGFGLGPQFMTAEQLGEHRGLGHREGEVQQGHGGVAGHDQARLADGLGQDMG